MFCVASRYCIILCSGWAMRRRCINEIVQKCCKCYFPITQNVVLCSFEVGGLGAMRRRCMQRSPNLNQTSCRGASARSSQGEKNKETDTSDLQHMINLIFKVKVGLDGKQDNNYHESGTIFLGPRSDHSLPMSVTHSLTN